MEEMTFGEFAGWATSEIWSASPLGLAVFAAVVLAVRARWAK